MPHARGAPPAQTRHEVHDLQRYMIGSTCTPYKTQDGLSRGEDTVMVKLKRRVGPVGRAQRPVLGSFIDGLEWVACSSSSWCSERRLGQACCCSWRVNVGQHHVQHAKTGFPSSLLHCLVPHCSSGETGRKRFQHEGTKGDNEGAQLSLQCARLGCPLGKEWLVRPHASHLQAGIGVFGRLQPRLST